MLLTRLPLRIATAFDLHVLGLPPAFVLSQDQTLKLNENLVPAGHYLYDESQAHLPANHRFANLVNLSYVTARVSHGRRHYIDSNVSGPQGLRRPRFSFFRFNCQTAKTRQTELSEQHFQGPALILSPPGRLDRAILGLKRREKHPRQPFKAALQSVLGL